MGALDGIVRDRIKLAINGLIIVNIIIDEKDEMLGEPWCDIRGLVDFGQSDCNFIDILEKHFDPDQVKIFNKLNKKNIILSNFNIIYKSR